MNGLKKVIESEFQTEIKNAIVDKLVELLGEDEVAHNYFTYFGATLDVQIQTYYIMHKHFDPEGFEMARSLLIKSAMDRDIERPH